MAFESNMAILWKIICVLIFCNTPYHVGGFTLTSPVANDVMLYLTNISPSSGCNTCNSTCPTRTKFPSYREPLNTAADGSCSLSSGSITNGNILIKFLEFNSASNISCFVVNFTESTTTNSYFSLTFWINSNISGSSHLVTIGNVAMSINGENLTIGSDSKPGLKKNEWTFISVTYNGVLSVFSSAKPIINQNLGPNNLSVLIGPNKALYVGESLKVGDVRWYPDVLTERELKSLSNGTFMPLTPDSECRCPPEKPFIDDTTVPFNGLRCTNYNKTASISRLNSNAGYPLFVADNYNSTYWSSGSINDISLTIQLLKLYQMNQIIIVGLNNTSDIEIIELNLVHGVRNTPLKFESNCSGGSCKNIIGHMTGVSFVYSFNEGGTTRTEYENLLAQKLVLSIKSKTAKEFQISEFIVKARCPCYGQDSACAITKGNYSCNCANYSGSYCNDCANEYYRTSNENLTCAECGCNSNGSVSNNCVKIGGKCQCTIGAEGDKCDKCKTNVETASGTCNACLAGFYNISRTDGCTECNCNIFGTNSNQTCNNKTGQCPCYGNVQGQMCDTCKNTFYDLATRCSKSCDCSAAGSTNLACDKTSGQCNCIQDPTQPNRRCIPLISSFTPEFGPLAGGTVVTITGELFGNLAVEPKILIGEDSHVIRNRNSTSIVFVTNKSYNGSRGISIRWSSNETTTKDGAMFEYRPDTNLSVMSNIAAYESGGCHIGFPGTFLDSVKHPRLVVYLDNNNTLESECSSSGTECSPTGEKVMCCKTPRISSMTTQMTLNFGFKLDGIANYTNISDYRFVFFKDPLVNKNIKLKLENTFDDGLLEVTGDGLNNACNDADIKITVGETPCPIQSRSDAKITCKINEKFPGKSRTEEIRVTIGNFTSVFGTVEFLSFWNTLGFYLILGGVCLFVVIILVVVACCCYRRRKSKAAGVPGFLDTESYDRKNRSGNEYVRMNPAAPIETAPMSEILSSASGSVPVARSVLAPTTSFLSPTPTSNTASTKVAFCERLDKPDAKLIESSVVLREHVELSKNPRCTNKGKLSRVIDGQFSDSSSRSTVGRNLTIKVLNERYPETGPIPEWLVKELRECTRFRDYYNDHVLRMMGIAIDATKVYILYEEMENRTLKEYMIMSTKDKVIPSVDLMELCLQVAEGMEYLSTLAVVHKDLACRNCWVGKDRMVKVADNSFSADLFSNEYMSENGSMVPVRWMAPESLKQGFFDAKSDVWSFGVLMWEVFTDCEYLPFYDIENDNDVKKKVCFEDYKLVSPESEECVANLMQDCFTTLGKDRPSFRDIINRLLNTISPGANQTHASYVNKKGKGNIGYINKGMTSTDNGEEDYENQGFLKKKKVEDDSEEDYMNTAFGKRH